MKKSIGSIVASGVFVLLTSTVIGATVKWTGGGDGSRWSDPNNWEGGTSIDFTKSHTYDLSGASVGANLVNDKVTTIGGFVFGAAQGTVTLTSSLTATTLKGTWNIPSGTTLVLKQPYSGMWTDYNSTTVTGGGTLRIDTATFESADRDWSVQDGTVVELARGYGNLVIARINLSGGSVLRIQANGTKIGRLATDATSSVELGTYNLDISGGDVGGYTIAGPVKGTGKLTYMGGKGHDVTTSFLDYTGLFSLANVGFRFANGFHFADGVAFEAVDNGVLTLGASQTFGSISGTATTGGLSVPAGAVATVTGSKVESGATMTFTQAIRGDGGLTVDAPGKTLLLNGVNTYKGPTHVASGALTLRNDYHTRFPDGLVSRYTFDETIYKDSGPENNPLAAPYAWSAPTLAEGGVGGTKCAHFSKQYLSLWSTRNLPFKGACAFTISYWMRPTQAAVSGGNFVVGSVDGQASSSQLTMTFAGGADHAQLMNVKGLGWVSAGVDLPDAWTHIVLTQTEDGTRTFYANGAKRSSTKVASSIAELSEQKFVLGDNVNNSWGASYFGDLDEVLIFNRALTADEVSGLYADPFQKGGTATVPSPVTHWTFDDSGAPGKDSQGLMDLEANGSVAVAKTDYTWGKAYKGESDTSGYLGWTGEFPAGFPTEKHSFTVSIRLTATGGYDGISPFCFGDLATAKAYFRLGVTWHPKVLAVDVSHPTAQNSFDVYLSDISSSGTTDEESALEHCVFAYDANFRTLTCYRDGVVKSTMSNVDITLPTSGSLYVGYSPLPTALASRRCRGLVDDLQIFDCALSGEQVRSLTRKLHFGETTLAGQSASPNSALTVDEGATVRFEGPAHVVKSLSGDGAVELAKASSVTLAGAAGFSGTVSGEGALTLADGCVLKVDAESGVLPALSVARTVTLPTCAEVVVAENATDLREVIDRTRVFAVIAAEGFENTEALATWTVPFADPGSYKFVVKDGKVLLKFRAGVCIIVR